MAIVVKDVRIFLKDNKVIGSSKICEVDCNLYTEIYFGGEILGIAKIKEDESGLLADIAIDINRGWEPLSWKNFVAIPIFVGGEHSSDMSSWDRLNMNSINLVVLPTSHNYCKMFGRLSKYEHEEAEIFL